MDWLNVKLDNPSTVTVLPCLAIVLSFGYAAYVRTNILIKLKRYVWILSSQAQWLGHN